MIFTNILVMDEKDIKAAFMSENDLIIITKENAELIIRAGVAVITETFKAVTEKMKGLENE